VIAPLSIAGSQSTRMLVTERGRSSGRDSALPARAADHATQPLPASE
jgi:hypothetical protein